MTSRSEITLKRALYMGMLVIKTQLGRGRERAKDESKLMGSGCTAIETCSDGHGREASKKA